MMNTILSRVLIVGIDITFALPVVVVVVFAVICRCLGSLLLLTHIKALIKTGKFVNTHIAKALLIELWEWGI